MSATDETLTPSELREQKKEERRKIRIERDSALHHVRTIYEPQIKNLKDEWHNAVLEIERNCTEQLKAVR